MPHLLNFNCPLCGSNHALHVCVKRGKGDYYKTEFFQCAGCTVMFRDIEKFTKLVRSTYLGDKPHKVEIRETRPDNP